MLPLRCGMSAGGSGPRRRQETGRDTSPPSAPVRAARGAGSISSIFLEPADLEAHVGRLAEKYRRLEEAECSWQDYCASDADVLVVSYGITSRVARAAVDRARREGLNAGMLRPITLYPFPTQALRQAASSVAAVLVVELSTGQLLEDVRLAVEGRASITHMSRTGGMIPTSEDVLAVLGKIGLKRVRCYA